MQPKPGNKSGGVAENNAWRRPIAASSSQSSTTNPPANPKPGIRAKTAPGTDAILIHAALQKGQFRHQHDIRKLVTAGIKNGPEDTLMALGGEKGLGLLRQIAEQPMSIDAGSRKWPVSFQRVVLPCLAMVLGFPDLYLNKLRAIYSVFFERDVFINSALQCAGSLLTRGNLDDRHSRSAVEVSDLPNMWSPTHWTEMMLLICKFVNKYLRIDTDAAAEARFRDWYGQLQENVEGWSKLSSVTEHEVAQKELATVLQNIKMLILPDDVRATNAKQAVIRIPVKRSFVRADQHGPGTLHPQGPRHDNDFKDFRKISIIPTFAETFCDKTPYLPMLGDPHHLEGVERYLDIQFRLVREDLLAALRRGIAGFVRDATRALPRLGEKGNFYRMEGQESVDLVLFRNMNVQALEAQLRSGISLRLSFDQPDKGKNDPNYWEKGLGSRHLQNGSIVVLWFGAKRDVKTNTPIESRHIFLAMVNNRNTKLLDLRGKVLQSVDANGNAIRRPQIGVELLDFVELLRIGSRFFKLADPDDEHLMFQVRGHFFNAGHAVLNSIQSFESDTVPFVDTLVHEKPTRAPPKYLLPGTRYDLTCLLKHPTTTTHPLQTVDVSNFAELCRILRLYKEQLVLDDTQITALAAAITHEIAIIQGPPGTGKTYLGVLILKVILHNADVIAAKRVGGTPQEAGRRLQEKIERIAGGQAALSAILPILCVCYTNHALDQFLEDLIKAGIPEDDIVRVGGRSKSIALANRNLQNVVFNSKTRDEIRRTKELEKETQELEASIVNFTSRHTLAPSRWKLDDLHVLLLDQVDAIAEGRMWFESDDDFQLATGGRNKSQDLLQQWLRCDDIQYQLGGWKKEVKDDEKVAVQNLYDLLGEDFDDQDRRDEREEVQAKPQSSNAMPLNEIPDPEYDRPLKELLADVRVWGMSRPERFILFEHWRQLYSELLVEDFEAKCRKYEEKRTEYQDIHAATQLRVLREAKIVGMTTSGAASHLKLLKNLRPSIIMCEEAGEVLEAHLLSCLNDNVTDLLQIGDEKQLRPKVEEYTLSMDSNSGYDLDKSFFERMVKIAEDQSHAKEEGMVAALATQWRMRPEISDLLRRTLYPRLEDAPAVLSHPKVRGMRENMYFFDHDHEEGGGSDGQSCSKINNFEADMVVALVLHLIKQGYEPHEIAVLTPYAGQLLNLRSRLMNKRLALSIDSRNLTDISKVLAGEEVDLGDDFDDEATGENDEVPDVKRIKPDEMKSVRAGDRVRLSTVDNFQGEEANVVVVSTVRCNLRGRTGFLKISNRVNVMCSRARHGQYFFGSSRTIKHSNEPTMFATIVGLMDEKGLVGRALPLQCDLHSDRVMNAYDAEQLQQLSPDGGCLVECGYRMVCGHMPQAVPSGRSQPQQTPVQGALHEASSVWAPLSKNMRGGLRSLRTENRHHTYRVRTCCKKEVWRYPGVLAHLSNVSARFSVDTAALAFVTCPANVLHANKSAPKRVHMPNAQRFVGRTAQAAPKIAFGSVLMGTGAAFYLAGHLVYDFHVTSAARRSYLKESIVDLVLLETFDEHDPDESPLVLLPCKHLLTIETLDGTTKLPDYYERDKKTGEWVEPLPFESSCKNIPSCPHCRSPIRNIRRYGRVINHAFLDQTIRKYNLNIEGKAAGILVKKNEIAAGVSNWRNDVDTRNNLRNNNPVRLAELKALIEKRKQHDKALKMLTKQLESLRIEATDDHPARRTFEKSVVALSRVGAIPGNHRASSEIVEEQRQMLQAHYARPSEEGFITAGICNIGCGALMVHHATNAAVALHLATLQRTPQRKGASNDETENETEVSVYLTTIKTFMKKYAKLHDKVQESCERTRSNRMALRAIRTHFADVFMSLESVVSLRMFALSGKSTETLQELIAENLEGFRALGQRYLELVGRVPQTVFSSMEPDQQSAAIRETVERAEQMCIPSKFYQAVTRSEKLQIFAAMGQDIGTGQGSFGGHWYTCPNGHVYTIGECGGAMHHSSCPECGELVGGSSHTLATGNRVATEYLQEIQNFPVRAE
ncbi:hypothetical protein PhCBS80983_g01564 [Powellomyces hirtus]|uniref:RZ-type domain-containing protein n=1 Tax=Powellomyces hirtus TaxID=109895 RepID=A0A507E9R2_9FUNG|nr:hypothetical protein PhCBS80983_g01564 [Powellomyces hirtus]